MADGLIRITGNGPLKTSFISANCMTGTLPLGNGIDQFYELYSSGIIVHNECYFFFFFSIHFFK